MSSNKNTEEKIFGVVAEFENPHQLIEAAKEIRKAGYQKFDTHSPFPIHGMDRAMGMGDSKLGWIVMCFALLGGIGGFLFMSWTSAVAYPLIISGKPLISTEAYIPVTFELTILFSAFSVVFGMLALNKLPMWYHPIFKYSKFYKASCDGFFVSIESTDPQFEEKKTKSFLNDIGGKNIEFVKD